ncbi:DNA binding domain-containing protein, excisionase family [Jiangella alkaliphila]|uniref:DNA binding domain-containing protein, excisionase family n=1 Tax=Jiangella alkaliphila TaxID=419479 RepID=A0A1H2GCT1_9ACTN|nr:DNA binding domain-containing protein, excisionase family [Jiangella alkaliphila]
MNEQPDTESEAADDQSPKLLKVREVAVALNVSAMTVYRDIEDGKVPATRIRGSWRVPASYVDDVLADALRRQAEAKARRPHVA